jgi:hypothetical protein
MEFRTSFMCSMKAPKLPDQLCSPKCASPRVGTVNRGTKVVPMMAGGPGLLLAKWEQKLGAPSFTGRAALFAAAASKGWARCLPEVLAVDLFQQPDRSFLAIATARNVMQVASAVNAV